jgi:hypothetical protein
MFVTFPGSAVAGLPARVASVAMEQFTQFLTRPGALGNPGFTFLISFFRAWSANSPNSQLEVSATVRAAAESLGIDEVGLT